MGGGERLGKWVLRLALKTGHSLFWLFFFCYTYDYGAWETWH